MHNEHRNKHAPGQSWPACILTLRQSPLTDIVNAKTAFFRANIVWGCQRLAKLGLVSRVAPLAVRGIPRPLATKLLPPALSSRQLVLAPKGITHAFAPI